MIGKRDGLRNRELKLCQSGKKTIGLADAGNGGHALVFMFVNELPGGNDFAGCKMCKGYGFQCHGNFMVEFSLKTV